MRVRPGNPQIWFDLICLSCNWSTEVVIGGLAIHKLVGCLIWCEHTSESKKSIRTLKPHRSQHDTVLTREAPIPKVTKTKMYWDAKAMPLLMRHRKTFCLYTCDTMTASILRSSPKLETVLVTLRSPLNVWLCLIYTTILSWLFLASATPYPADWKSSIITGSQNVLAFFLSFFTPNMTSEKNHPPWSKINSLCHLPNTRIIRKCVPHRKSSFTIFARKTLSPCIDPRAQISFFFRLWSLFLKFSCLTLAAAAVFLVPCSRLSASSVPSKTDPASQA